MKKAFLNDGRSPIEYTNIEELQNKIREPYSSFYPLEEYKDSLDENKGRLIGKDNISVGRYEVILE